MTTTEGDIADDVTFTDSTTIATDDVMETSTSSGYSTNTVMSTLDIEETTVVAIKRESDDSEFPTPMIVGIFIAVGVVFIAIMIICTVCCCKYICQKKKKPVVSSTLDRDTSNIHSYTSKLTNSVDSSPSGGTPRYTPDPTNQSHTSYGGVYQVIPEEGGATSGHDYGSQMYSRPIGMVREGNKRQFQTSGSYAVSIEEGYRGSQKHPTNTTPPHMGAQQQPQHNIEPQIQMQPRVPARPVEQVQPQVHHRPVEQVQPQAHHTNTSGEAHVYDSHIGMGGYQSQSPPHSYGINHNPRMQQGHAQPVLSQTPSAHVALPPHIDAQVQHHTEPRAQVRHNQQPAYNPALDPAAPRVLPARIPRNEPHFVPYNHANLQYQRRYATNPHPPATHPNPSRSIPHAQPSIDMSAMKQNLRHSKPKQTENKQSEINEISMHPLFNKVKQIIDSGCKTIRLYKTTAGFAVQGFTDDEQDVYTDAETSRAHLPPESEEIMDYHHEHDTSDSEDIYEFIRSSVLVNNPEHVEEVAPEDDTGGELYTAPNEPADHGDMLYQEPSEMLDQVVQYEGTSGTAKRKLPHDTLKEQCNQLGLMRELQTQISHSEQQQAEDYEDVTDDVRAMPLSAHNHTQAGPCEAYVNEEVINDLKAGGPAALRNHTQGEYANHDAIQRISQEQAAQEHYENAEEINRIRQGQLNHGFQPDYQQEDYENSNVINQLRQNAPQNSGGENLYQNSAEARTVNKPTVSHSDHNTGMDPDLAAKMAARRDRLTLRNSMCNTELSQNVDNLFDDALGDEIYVNEPSQEAGKVPPVLRKKHLVKSKDSPQKKTEDCRISRSSFFEQIEDEQGQDKRTNMGAWRPDQAVTAPMMTPSRGFHAKTGGPFKLLKS